MTSRIRIECRQHQPHVGVLDNKRPLVGYKNTRMVVDSRLVRCRQCLHYFLPSEITLNPEKTSGA